MAAQHGVANSDYVPDEFFPDIRAAGTLAPGTVGAQSNTNLGPALASVDLHTPDSGSRTLATVKVFAGDTSSQSDDDGAPVTSLCPGPGDQYVNTGAGSGSAVSATSHNRYPWQQAAK